MERLIGVLLFAVLFASPLHANEFLRKTIAISEIDGLEIQGAGALKIIQGETEKLVITAVKKHIDQIDVFAEGSTLKILWKPNNDLEAAFPGGQVNYLLQVKDIERIQLNGSIDLEVEGDIVAKHFEIESNGSSDIELRNIQSTSFASKTSGSGDFKAQAVNAKNISLKSIGSNNIDIASLNAESTLTLANSGAGDLDIEEAQAKTLSVDLSGYGDATINGGVVTSQSVVVSGAGEFDAKAMKSSKADVDLSGASNVSIWVEEELDAKVTGGSKLRYYGKPVVTKSVSRASTIQSLGMPQY